MTQRSVRYGSETLEFELPSGRLIDEVGAARTEAVSDPSSVISRALQAPYGSSPLREAVKGSGSVTVLVDDNTRPTPVHLIAPHIVEHLEHGGIGRTDIRFLIAAGTHRAMTNRELEHKLGSEIASKYQVYNHHYENPDALCRMGTTPSGVPITANRIARDADFLIGVGNIVPHRYCGWSGGAKIIQPGIGGEATTAETHLMITRFPDVRLGVVENKVREEMESVAERVGLKFIVNTVLTHDQRLYDVVAGDFRQAFREGVRRAESVYSCPITQRADVVIASSFPSDLNLWQAAKALYSAELMVQPEGIIILVSPCYEGVGEHDEFCRLLALDYQTVDAMITNGEVRDRVGAAAVLAVALVRKHATVYLVSEGIVESEAETMGIEVFGNLQHAIDKALRVKGPGSTVSIAHEATEILPRLADYRA